LNGELCREIIKNGDYYEGGVLDGKKEGKGKFVKANGGKREGLWNEM